MADLETVLSGKGALRLANRPALRGDWLGILALVATALALFVPVWATNRVWIDGDLGDFYWPTMQAVFGALRRAESPVWNPNMTGGFPLFADGSVGTLFPLNWVLLLVPQGLMLIPFGRLLLAALGMYVFVRVVGGRPLGATVAGLAFALNGFSVSHLSHIDLNNGTAMLPWVLLAVERSARAAGWRQQVGWLLGVGIAYGLAWLSLHPMAPLMILPVYAGWVVYTVLPSPFGRGVQERTDSDPGVIEPSGQPPLPEGFKGGQSGSLSPWERGPAGEGAGGRGGGRRRLRRWGWLLAALVVPIVIALGLAAAQLLPMWELGQMSPRQTAGARFNASFSLPPYNLIGLIWPTFFHSPPGGPQWGLWNLETLVYLGTLPFVLALIAVAAWPKGRHVGFFVVTALLALWVAFAVYAPLSPQPLLYSLPGYNVLRTPARFFYIAGFAGAYLAAVGADWLLARPRDPAAARRVRRLLLALLALAVLIPMVGVAILLFVNGIPRQAERAIWAFYLNLPHGTPLRYEDVVYALNEKLRPANLEMWKSVGLLLAGVGLVWVWLRERLAMPLFSLAVVLLTAVDLTYLATHYVTPVPLERVVAPRPVAEYVLTHRAATAEASLNGDRILHARQVDPPMIDLPFGVPDFNGQTSLNMARPAAYTAALFDFESTLPDLAAVRWTLIPNTLPDLRQRLNGVAYDRNQPLTVVAARTPEFLRTFNTTPRPARELRLLLALSQAAHVSQGDMVAEIVARAADGTERRFPIRAGVEASEWAYDRPDVRAVVRHEKAPPAVSWSQVDETGQRFDRHLFYVELPLAADGAVFEPTQVEVREVDPKAEVRLFGITVIGAISPAAESLTRTSLTRYELVYGDHDARLFESRTRLLRAYLVGQGVTYDARWLALERLQADPDITRRVTLEGALPADAKALTIAGPTDPRAPLPPAPDPAGLGDLRIVEDTPTQVTLTAATSAPTFLVLADTNYVGWQATVDGVQTPILQANYNFRAVYLPPGSHTVTFSFAPASVRMGALASLLTMALVLGAGGWLWRGARREA